MSTPEDKPGDEPEAALVNLPDEHTLQGEEKQVAAKAMQLLRSQTGKQSLPGVKWTEFSETGQLGELVHAAVFMYLKETGRLSVPIPRNAMIDVRINPIARGRIAGIMFQEFKMAPAIDDDSNEPDYFNEWDPGEIPESSDPLHNRGMTLSGRGTDMNTLLGKSPEKKEKNKMRAKDKKQKDERRDFLSAEDFTGMSFEPKTSQDIDPDGVLTDDPIEMERMGRWDAIGAVVEERMDALQEFFEGYTNEDEEVQKTAGERAAQISIELASLRSYLVQFCLREQVDHPGGAEYMSTVETGSFQAPISFGAPDFLEDFALSTSEESLAKSIPSDIRVAESHLFSHTISEREYEEVELLMERHEMNEKKMERQLLIFFYGCKFCAKLEKPSEESPIKTRIERSLTLLHSEIMETNRELEAIDAAIADLDPNWGYVPENSGNMLEAQVDGDTEDPEETRDALNAELERMEGERNEILYRFFHADHSEKIVLIGQISGNGGGFLGLSLQIDLQREVIENHCNAYGINTPDGIYWDVLSGAEPEYGSGLGDWEGGEQSIEDILCHECVPPEFRESERHFWESFLDIEDDISAFEDNGQYHSANLWRNRLLLERKLWVYYYAYIRLLDIEDHEIHHGSVGEDMLTDLIGSLEEEVQDDIENLKLLEEQQAQVGLSVDDDDAIVDFPEASNPGWSGSGIDVNEFDPLGGFPGSSIADLEEEPGEGASIEDADYALGHFGELSNRLSELENVICRLGGEEQAPDIRFLRGYWERLHTALEQYLDLCSKLTTKFKSKPGEGKEALEMARRGLLQRLGGIEGDIEKYLKKVLTQLGGKNESAVREIRGKTREIVTLLRQG